MSYKKNYIYLETNIYIIVITDVHKYKQKIGWN